MEKKTRRKRVATFKKEATDSALSSEKSKTVTIRQNNTDYHLISGQQDISKQFRGPIPIRPGEIGAL